MSVNRMTEWERVYFACKSAQSEGIEISDAVARVIGSWYAGNQTSESASFATTGAIENPTTLWHDITENGKLYTEGNRPDRLILDMLGTYLLNAGERGPVAGWSNLWV